MKVKVKVKGNGSGVNSTMICRRVKLDKQRGCRRREEMFKLLEVVDQFFQLQNQDLGARFGWAMRMTSVGDRRTVSVSIYLTSPTIYFVLTPQSANMVCFCKPQEKSHNV